MEYEYYNDDYIEDSGECHGLCGDSLYCDCEEQLLDSFLRGGEDEHYIS